MKKQDTKDLKGMKLCGGTSSIAIISCTFSKICFCFSFLIPLHRSSILHVTDCRVKMW